MMDAWRKLVAATDALWRTDPGDEPSGAQQKLICQLLSVTLVIVALWGGFQAARYSQYQKNGWITLPAESEQE